MGNARKICHFCEQIIPDGFYVSISARHISREVHDVELAFHMDCFNELAGDDYTQQLALKIKEWVENTKPILASLKKPLKPQPGKYNPLLKHWDY
jgi:hypothetical protein